MSNLDKEFWDRMADVRAVMLGIKGQGALVPMSPQLDDDRPGHIWFITAKGTDLAMGAGGGSVPAQVVVSDPQSGLYADVSGVIAASDDSEALDEVWSFVADAWFEGGQSDPDICLLRFTPDRAEMSITPTSGTKFLYEIAKAQMTGTKPDAGEQGTVTF